MNTWIECSANRGKKYRVSFSDSGYADVVKVKCWGPTGSYWRIQWSVGDNSMRMTAATACAIRAAQIIYEQLMEKQIRALNSLKSAILDDGDLPHAASEAEKCYQFQAPAGYLCTECGLTFEEHLGNSEQHQRPASPEVEAAIDRAVKPAAVGAEVEALRNQFNHARTLNQALRVADRAIDQLACLSRQHAGRDEILEEAARVCDWPENPLRGYHKVDMALDGCAATIRSLKAAGGNQEPK